ncbi:lantibiotic immunity ABC transporter MutE/EpiE family permease subunit [Eubacteriaceae bacterium ES2]|nr:lantibiotic immunity ABC transporter MutE/EpiE family permease subunit [Eubacteriaceae bacterium ES2]
MVNCLKSELLKQKHRFTLKLLWLGPLVPLAVAFILMGGRYFFAATFNWWYTLILPGTLSMMVAFTVTAEKRHNRHGLFAVLISKKDLWLAQLFLNTGQLLLINLLLCIYLIVFSGLLGISISFYEALVGSLVLFVTFAWQIPLFLLISEKTGSFFTIMFSLICNMAFGIFLSPTKLWMVPFAIPARLMCPIIKVLPNGLPLEVGNPLADGQVVLPGIIITVSLYFIFSFMTTIWFNKGEVK